MKIVNIPLKNQTVAKRLDAWDVWRNLSRIDWKREWIEGMVERNFFGYNTKQNNNLPLKMCNVGQLHCVIDGFPITESISIDEMAIPHLRTNADSLSGAVVERIQLSRIAT